MSYPPPLSANPANYVSNVAAYGPTIPGQNYYALASDHPAGGLPVATETGETIIWDASSNSYVVTGSAIGGLALGSGAVALGPLTTVIKTLSPGGAGEPVMYNRATGELTTGTAGGVTVWVFSRAFSSNAFYIYVGNTTYEESREVVADSGINGDDITIAHANGVWLVSLGGNTNDYWMSVSSDASVWRKISANNPFLGARGLAWCPYSQSASASTWVAGGTAPTFFTSYNAVNWIAGASLATTAVAPIVRCAKWCGGTVMLGGNGNVAGVVYPWLWWSNDGGATLAGELQFSAAPGQGISSIETNGLFTVVGLRVITALQLSASPTTLYYQGGGFGSATPFTAVAVGAGGVPSAGSNVFPGRVDFNMLDVKYNGMTWLCCGQQFQFTLAQTYNIVFTAPIAGPPSAWTPVVTTTSTPGAVTNTSAFSSADWNGQYWNLVGVTNQNSAQDTNSIFSTDPQGQAGSWTSGLDYGDGILDVSKVLSSYGGAGWLPTT